MQFSITSVVLIAIASLSAIADAHVELGMFSSENCSGKGDFHSIRNGCIRVENKRSLDIQGHINTCEVITWSGQDCRGSSAVHNTKGCRFILYGSVSVNCRRGTP